MSDKEKIEKWLSEHDGEERCHYCMFDDDCPHGIACYGGSPLNQRAAITKSEIILIQKIFLKTWKERTSEKGSKSNRYI